MQTTNQPMKSLSVHHRQNGFTLVEMMIVAAVIAILAAIAYPAYTEQLLKSQRAEGKAALMRAT